MKVAKIKCPHCQREITIRQKEQDDVARRVEEAIATLRGDVQLHKKGAMDMFDDILRSLKK